MFVAYYRNELDNTRETTTHLDDELKKFWIVFGLFDILHMLYFLVKSFFIFGMLNIVILC